MAARKLPARLNFVPVPALLFALFGVAATAWAAPTPPKSSPPPPPSAPATATAAPPDSAAEAASVRARAEGYYKKGWKESEDAKADLKNGKPKDANKKFAKALQHYDQATKLDPNYFEAWNMVGFCARKTGDLKRSFAAYDKALAIEPEFDEAHEYLGEAYLMSGNIEKAKEQLEWLKQRQSDEAAELEEAIEAVEKGGTAADHSGSGW